jgi:hypothetical protein
MAENDTVFSRLKHAADDGLEAQHSEECGANSGGWDSFWFASPGERYIHAL